ncbi:hypothetical protein BU23DRAFT_334788 [Bimuria novae-zelandiae CBS 107.79]|uniref:Uncharacterized protein n=1 Tax=Bimuria novae-zelandiae CBS 107.79 TaxID=1447943 RepID=A0A6A5UQ77_9PLEO|nr:hypothetical protein BU23DRAFT_334788 [Bimuria novae-zelandiae CBS 107.79]
MSQESTASDKKSPAPPVISITAAQDDIFDHDTRDFLQEWENKYAGNGASVSQAEFFAPVDLLATGDVSTSRNAILEEDDIPLHPSAPRIIISEPDAIAPEPQSVLRKASRLNKKTSFLNELSHAGPTGPLSPQRRHSIISIVPERHKSSDDRSVTRGALPRPTVQPWTTTEIHPKGGCKMRVRYVAGGTAVDVVAVYLFNSASLNPLDRDADLALFSHSDHVESRKGEVSPTRKVQRARTDIGRQSNQGAFECAALKQGVAHHQTDAQRSQRKYVNWLADADMLQTKIPGMRLVTIGFDIKSNLNFEAAARQLHDYLQQHRNERPTIPMIFLGHSLGCLFILKALSDYETKLPAADAMLSDTAGLFLFSSYSSFPPARIQALANMYGAKHTERIFSELSKNSTVERISKAARTRLYSQHQTSAVSSAEGEARKNNKGVSIGFPIFQVFARDEVDPSSLTALLGTPVRTITVAKDSSSVLKFPNSQDSDFLHLTMLMQSALQTHKLLHAAVSGRVDEIHSLIRRGTNTNLRDRWSQTALQIAVRMNHEDVVVRLLGAKNMDPNVRDRLGNAPLHYAVRNTNEAIVRALIHNGADIGLENQRKRTPKDLAEKHRSRRHITKLLKSKLMSGPDQSFSSKLIGNGKAPTSGDGILACKNFQITITEIYATRNSDKHWSVNVSVEALLYGTSTLNEILHQVRPRAVKKESPVCTWIHVPENNMVWIEDLFAKLRMHPAIWQDTRRSVTDSLRNRAITPHFNAGDRRSLFLPYISFEANFRQAKRTTYTHVIDATYQQQRNAQLPFTTSALAALTEGSSRASTSDRRPLLQVPEGINLESYPYLEEDSDSDFSEILEPDDPDDLEEEEKASINAYLYNPPALHVRRTLDQYYYHMLESTHERDIDQVVSRWAQTVIQEPRHNILMVDQLWLWVGQNREPAAPGEIEMEMLRRRDHSSDRAGERSPHRHSEHYVVSCFPNRIGSGQLSYRTLDDLRLRVLDPSSRKRDPIHQPEDLVSRILETCCSTFDRMQDVQMLRFFQMFEDSVGTIDDKESRLFRDFQRGSNRLLELDHGNKYYNEKKNALLTDLLDIREEIKLLVEVKDIRDEVNIILTVLNIQRTLVDQMSQSSSYEDDSLLRTPIVKNMILADINDFTKLDGQARTIQEKLNTLMDLKQKAANAWEAKEARETAVATGKQGNTVLVFTVVTIIFLPLSFMSSFFAIGIAAFPRDPASGGVNWPLGTVMGILFGVALSVSIPLIIFALNMDYFTALYKELRYNYLAVLGMRVIPLLPPLGSSEGATAYRRRWTRLLQQYREDYMKNDNEVMEKVEMGHRGELGTSFPSTASSHTFVDDSEDAGSARARRSYRRFRSKRKTEDDEKLIES